MVHESIFMVSKNCHIKRLLYYPVSYYPIFTAVASDCSLSKSSRIRCQSADLPASDCISARSRWQSDERRDISRKRILLFG